MEIWSIFFFMSSIGVIIVPLYFCYKIFNKAEKKSYLKGFLIFFVSYSLAFLLGLQFLKNMPIFTLYLFLLAMFIPIVFAISNYRDLKKMVNNVNDDHVFNHAFGIIGSLGFFNLVGLGTVIALIKDTTDEDEIKYKEEHEMDMPMRFRYRKNAWIYFFMELIFLSGFCSSIITEFYTMKNKLPKHIPNLIAISQMILFILSNVYKGYVHIVLILLMGSLSIAHIYFGVQSWKKYYTSEQEENEAILEQNTAPSHSPQAQQLV